MQMKGVVDRIDVPTQAHDERVSAHVEQFIAEVALLGVNPGHARSLFLGDLIVVSFTVTDLFDQTPRSGAGSKLW
jgi:hypothetical protein